MKTLESFLAVQPVLKDMATEDVHLLTSCASNVRFAANHMLFRTGEPADAFYLIREGAVSVEISCSQERHLTIQTLGEGEVLGWSWLFPPYNWQFDARALEQTRAIALDARCLRGKCDEDPRLGYDLMKRFSHILQDRLLAARLQLLDLYGTGHE